MQLTTDQICKNPYLIASSGFDGIQRLIGLANNEMGFIGTE
jgi:hypothetical protein